MSLDNERIKKKIIEKFQTNHIIGYVCKNVGIGRSTFYRWREEDPEFKKTAKKAQNMGRDNICDAAESKVINLMNSDSEEIALKAAKTILGAHHPAYRTNRIATYQKLLLKEQIAKFKQGEHDLEKITVQIIDSKGNVMDLENLDKAKNNNGNQPLKNEPN